MISTRRLSLVDGDGKTTLTPRKISELTQELVAETSAVVAIEGTARSFCEGLDLNLAAGSTAASRGEIEGALRAFATLLDKIQRHPRPVIALVDGTVRGGGVGIVAAADLVLATSRSSFALPEVLLGLIPAVVLPVLCHRVGVASARLLALGVAPWSTEEAHRRGLVDEVVEDLDVALCRHENRFSRLDGAAIASVKELVSRRFGLDESVTRFSTLLDSQATQERLNRFARGETPWGEEVS